MVDTVRLNGTDIVVETLKTIYIDLLESTFKNYTEGYLEDTEKDTINCYTKEDVELIKEFSDDKDEQNLLDEIYKLFENRKIDLVVFEY